MHAVDPRWAGASKPEIHASFFDRSSRLSSAAITHIQTRHYIAAMNWTGGTLQRTRQANKGVLQQQRAYFAKARTHLQNATNKPIAPFYPSYLCDNNESGPLGMPSFDSGSVRHMGHSVKRPRERAHHEDKPNDRRSAISGHEVFPHETSSRRVAFHSPQYGAPHQAQEGSCGDRIQDGLSDAQRN